MLQAGGAQLVLVLTHGASAHWKGRALRGFVRQLGRDAVLAIVQMLPSDSWGHTNLGAAAERVRGRERAVVNRLLKRRDLWTGAFADRGGLDAVPMLSLQPEALADWARFVMSPRLVEHAAVALDEDRVRPVALDVTLAEAPDPDALRRVVRGFQAFASPQAFTLLRLLAASWITLPVMRLLLQSLPAPRSPAPLAEVLLSGLLLRVSPPGTPANELAFEFVPGLRDWLLDTLSSEERRQVDDAMADSRESIRRFVETRSGVKLSSFSALLRDPQGSEFLPASAKAFVEVYRRLRGQTRPGDDARSASAKGAPGAAHAAVVPTGGGRYNFPPEVLGLVERPALEAHVLKLVLSLRPGETLTLTARPNAGATTLLATVLRRPDVLARFSGGIWFDVVPPRRQAGDAPGTRMMFCGMSTPDPVARKLGRDDVRIDLHEAKKDASIGYIGATDAAAHLKRLGLAGRQIEQLQGIHQGVPCLVPLVGVGSLVGVPAWPISKGRLEMTFNLFALTVLQALTAEQRQALIERAVLQPDFPVTSAQPRLVMAEQLAWMCRGAPGFADTLQPSIGEWLQDVYPEDAAPAHRTLLDYLVASLSRADLKPYVQHRLLQHAAGADGTQAVRRVLFDRAVLGVLLEGPRAGLLQQLRAWGGRDSQIRDLAKRLATAEPNASLVDTARRALAPLPPWWAAIGVDERLRHDGGAGVRVALISSGFDARHPELQHLGIAQGDTDVHGNGTAEASIIAGCFIGLAPRVRLRSVNVMNADGMASSFDIAKALHTLLAEPVATRPHIVCMPFGIERADPVIARSLKPLAAEGVLLIAPAGNSGREGVDFPASLSEVLGVGAVDDDGTVAPFSNGGEATRSKRRERTGSDLWAPGVDVLAAWPVAKAMEGHGILQDDAAPYARLSGTSFSCAVVTGLAALYAGITGLRGAALRQLLVRTAPQGRVRFDPPVDSTTSPIPASSQAEPERDVVVLQIREGPELILHPQTARALFGVAKTSVR
jgi:hypothetical protein